jgi:hypothetical protein
MYAIKDLNPTDNRLESHLNFEYTKDHAVFDESVRQSNRPTG